MVKSELIQKLCNTFPNLLHHDLERIVNIVFDEITNIMIEKKRLQLRGFGTFSTKIRKARVSRNPRTGEQINTKKKIVPVFKMSKLIKLRLNKAI